MKGLIKANAVTNDLPTVRTIPQCDTDALRELYTGIDGKNLYVLTGEWCISRGIQLKCEAETEEDKVGLLTSYQWTHRFKQLAAEKGQDKNRDIVRKSYTGQTLWNVDWLDENFAEVSERVEQEILAQFSPLRRRK